MLLTMTTAACIIIGDEILSGKVKDTNVGLLIETLAEQGVTLKRIATIGDEPQAIANEVRRCSEEHDYVFTSGGLGPTHDDRTIEGIALAFGVEVESHPDLERLIKQHWGSGPNKAAFKMAEVPAGARLLTRPDDFLPAIIFRNIYILPGVPQLFSAKLQHVSQELEGTKLFLKSIYLCSDESSIADHLRRVEREVPRIKIGSYPRLDSAKYKVRVTIEGEREDDVLQAIKQLEQLIPAEQIVKVE